MFEFLKPKTVYKVLQVAKVDRPLDTNDDIRASLVNLSGHPGFQWLLTKLRFQKAVLEAKLASERYDNIQDYHLLQSGIIWLKYLEDTVDREVSHKTSKPLEELPRAMRPSIDDLRKHIELIGQNKSA